jgi:GntR family transcriptional repressor for pyruvate dehydrogenase complex
MQAKLTAFEDALIQKNLVGLIQADIGFHRLIGLATKNKTLQLFSDTVSRLLMDCWKATLRVSDRPKKTVREHRAIYKAIQDGDASKAKRVMRQHLKKGLDNLRKLGLE